MEMQPVSKEEMASSWDDPKYLESVLKKGQRRITKSNKVEVEEVKELMLCSNCAHPVSLKEVNRCKCSIWDVGKNNPASSEQLGFKESKLTSG